MSKFQPYSRRELNRRRKQWHQRNTQLVLLLACGIAGLLAFASFVVVYALPRPVEWYVLGLVHAGVAAAGLHLLNSAFLAHDREALWHVRGAWGEDNTRSELQRAKRKRLIWGWVDSISFQAGDLDHVVITRRGGVVALDSKWRNEIPAHDTAAMARAAQKARVRAEGLTQTVLKSERGARHRARLPALSVMPVVVLWGTAQTAVPEGALIDGVRFVAGRQLLPWQRGLEGDDVSKVAARDTLERLEQFRASAWQDV